MTDFRVDKQIDEQTATLWIICPYEPKVSVNRAYNKNNPRYGKRREVAAWLVQLKTLLGRLGLYRYPVLGQVRMDLWVYAPRRRGRLPDTSNFRKLPQDIIALALGVDDSCFGGTDHPAIRVRTPSINICLHWQHMDDGTPSQPPDELTPIPPKVKIKLPTVTYVRHTVSTTTAITSELMRILAKQRDLFGSDPITIVVNKQRREQVAMSVAKLGLNIPVDTSGGCLLQEIWMQLE